MNRIILIKIFLIVGLLQAVGQVKPPLGTTSNFTVLAGSRISSVGNTVIYDNVGIWPGNTLTGFPPGVINGAQHINNATAQTAQTDLTTAYNQLAAQTFTSNLSGQNLGGKTLGAGVYRFNGNADLTGTLTLDASGNPNAVFIFQIAGNLTTSQNAVVSMRQGARSPNIFWQVGNSVTIDAGTNFNGSVLANQNITMGNGAILQGRVMARNGFVELDNNPLTIPPPRFNSDISIEKTISPGPYYVGNQVIYKIVVKNLGPNNETNLLVKDLLPAGLSFVSATTSNNIAYNASTGFWSVDNLLNGNTDTLTIKALITSASQITNTATVAGDGIDNNPGNNISNVNLCSRPPKPGVITGPPVLCMNTTNTSYSIASVPGATGYTWSVPTGWLIVSGQGTTSINLATGTDTAFAVISVTALNICGESLPSTKKVIPSPPPPVLPGITGNPVPCRNSTGNIYSIPLQPGVKNYTWSVPAGWIITAGLNTNAITVTAGLNAGTISVIASNDCGASQPVSLTVMPAPLPPVAPGAITPPFAGNPCVGQAGLTYSIASVLNASSYTWTVPAGWTITSGQGTTNITVTIGSNSGTIAVVASNGCGTSPASTLNITPVTTPPAAPSAITGETVPCIGQISVAYSVAPQSGITAYSWTVPTGWSIISGANTPRIVVAIGSNAGTISVTTTNGCGTSVATTLVVTPANTVPPSPASIVSSSSGSPCSGQTNLTYTVVPVSGASAFTWTVPSGWTITSGQGTPSINVTAGSVAGSVSVVAVNGCGSSIASTLALTPTSTPPPAPGAIAGNEVPCVGSTLNSYSIPVVTGATNYTWSVPAGWVITSGQGTTSITLSVNPGAVAGNISVTASNGCGPGTASLLPVTPAISVPPVPTTITGGTTVCINQTNVTYTVTPVAGASGYTWAVPAGWTIVSGQGTASVVVNIGSNPGTITVAATNGCGAGVTQALTIIPTTNPPVTPGQITGNIVPCTGQSNVAYTILPVTGANSYTWSVPAGWIITSGQGTTTITVTTSNASGNVSVSAVNTCGAGVASTLAVQPSSTAAPAPGPITGTSVPCIGQTNITYSIAAITGASAYSWSLPAGWIINSGNGTTSITVTAGSVAGNVSVTASNGCGSGVASMLAVSPAFTPPVTPSKITGNSVPCASGGTLTYSVQAMSNVDSFNWTVPSGWTIISGQGTTTIIVMPGNSAGTISVTATNGCGTGTASSLNVMVSTTTPPTPGPITAPFSGSPCSGQTALVYSIAPVAGASSYTWTVPAGWVITAGDGTTSITVTAGNNAGLVTVMAENGCGKSAASTLATTPTTTPPLSSGTLVGSLTPCVGNTATTYTTTAVAGAIGYTWTVPVGWTITSGQGTTAITVTPGNTSGIVTVTASNGCGAGTPDSLSVVPTFNAPIIAGQITGNGSVCGGESNLTYTIAPVTGAVTYDWQVPADWIILSGQGTNTITVKAGATDGDISVKAQNDCGASPASLLAVVVRPTLVFSGNIKEEGTPCVGLRYSVTPVPGATTYSWILPQGWTITSGEGTPSIQVTASSDTGTVSVIAQNASCTSFALKAQVKANIIQEPEAPNAFSPNGDNVNDRWEIKNLENYPDNDLTIINRWGNEVYRQKSYRNTWYGSQLSPGTYYYILRVKLCNDREKTFKGYVMIIR